MLAQFFARHVGLNVFAGEKLHCIRCSAARSPAGSRQSARGRSHEAPPPLSTASACRLGLTASEENENPLTSTPFWRQIVAQPYKADIFAVLRWIDSKKKNGAKLGRAARPHFDPIRLGQEPSLTFAASTIASVSEASDTCPPRLNIYSFGLFGPNGPLPLHLTEFARDRLRRYNDPTLVRFADIFHHRLILLFYRAWADAQPSVSMDHARVRPLFHLCRQLDRLRPAGHARTRCNRRPRQIVPCTASRATNAQS